MVLNGVPLLHVLLPFLCAPQNSNEKRKPKRVKWVYDHLGRLWMSFRCRSDVVSDVVQIAVGIQKFDILLCDRSKHSETSGRTNNKPDVIKERRGPHAINIAAE